MENEKSPGLFQQTEGKRNEEWVDEYSPIGSNDNTKSESFQDTREKTIDVKGIMVY